MFAKFDCSIGEFFDLAANFFSVCKHKFARVLRNSDSPVPLSLPRPKMKC